MLRAVISTFNDMPLLEKCIESVYDKVDEIVAVDGKYKDFPGDEPYSTDGTLEYLETIDKVQTILGANVSEIEKRNKYLIGEYPDVYVHVDADEEWVGEVSLPPGKLMMITKMKRNYPNYYINRIRLFAHVPGLHYEKKHYWLHDARGRTFALLSKPGGAYESECGTFEDIKLLHHEKERPHTRQLLKDKYYNILRQVEDPITEVI